jgi:hypothetical protein
VSRVGRAAREISLAATPSCLSLLHSGLLLAKSRCAVAKRVWFQRVTRLQAAADCRRTAIARRRCDVLRRRAVARRPIAEVLPPTNHATIIAPASRLPIAMIADLRSLCRRRPAVALVMFAVWAIGHSAAGRAAGDLHLGDAPRRAVSQDTSGWLTTPARAKAQAAEGGQANERASVVQLYQTLYVPGEAGYIDYPTLEQAA